MIIRSMLNKLLKTFDNNRIALLLGPRQVGKTTLLYVLKTRQESKDISCYFYTLEDPDILTLLNQHPDNIFKLVPKDTKLTLFLDEIQYLDAPSRFLKYIYDSYKGQIKLVVTGSSAFYIDQKFTDSLAGRKEIFRLYPFTFLEYLRAKEEADLASCISQQQQYPFQKRVFLLAQKNQLQGYLSDYFTFGGYPDVVLADTQETQKKYLRELRDSFLKKDFLDAKIKYEDKAVSLLKILAAQVGQLVNTQNLSNQLDLSHDAIQNYLYIFQKSFIISLVRPFYRNIKKELTKMPKVYFYDTGFLNSMLNQFEPLELRLNSGGIFENMVFQSLLQYDMDSIRFWRTSGKNEVDFILDEKVALECKLNAKSFNPAKYKLFQAGYPNISLEPLTYQDDSTLSLLDIA